MPNEPGFQIRYVVQPYIKGARGALAPGTAELFETEERGRRRAKAAFEGGTALGVLLVRQSGDAALGEFDEPVILLKLGRVPEAD